MGVNTTAKEYDVDTGGDLSTDIQRFTEQLYTDSDPNSSDVYVIAICSLECLVQLLREVRVTCSDACVQSHNKLVILFETFLGRPE